mmetsp:Transcript_7140/g.10716  ORF Transcript_7140/g.10716 Transcript_7140/m.10716 type:complete len:479 (-) Transcript_7140:40-1476(-)
MGSIRLQVGERFLGRFSDWLGRDQLRKTCFGKDPTMVKKLYYTAVITEVNHDKKEIKFSCESLGIDSFASFYDIRRKAGFVSSSSLPEGALIMKSNISDDILFDCSSGVLDLLQSGPPAKRSRLSKEALSKHAQTSDEKMQVAAVYVRSQLDLTRKGVVMTNGMKKKLSAHFPALRPGYLEKLFEHLTEVEARAMMDHVQMFEDSLSVSTPAFDPLDFIKGLLSTIGVRMHKALARTDFQTRREGKGFTLGCPSKFAMGPLLSLALIAGFEVTKQNGSTTLCSGNAKNLQLMGVSAECNEALLDPYYCAEFMDLGDVKYLPYYNSHRVRGTEADYPLVVNPNAWDVDHLVEDDRVERELGSEQRLRIVRHSGDSPEKTKQRIVNALIRKRIENSEPELVAKIQKRANFGFKSLSSVNPEKPIELTIKSDDESGGMCSLLVHFSAVLHTFTGQCGRDGRLKFDVRTFPKEKRNRSRAGP